MLNRKTCAKIAKTQSGIRDSNPFGYPSHSQEIADGEHKITSCKNQTHEFVSIVLLEIQLLSEECRRKENTGLITITITII